MEQISHIDGARIDRNYRQGDKAVLEQLFKRDGKRRSEVDVLHLVEDTRNGLQEITKLIAPYQIPEDYRFFLEYCGGLIIKTKESVFHNPGLGPMVMEWYEDLVALNDFPESGHKCILIGDISFKTKSPPTYQGVAFILDVAGIIQQNSIIGLGPDNTSISQPFSDSDDDKRTWKKIANSFTEWLELAAQTNGTFGYF